MAVEKIGPNKWHIKVSVRVPGKDYPVTKWETFTGTKVEAEERKSEMIREAKDASGSLKIRNSLSTFGDLVELVLSGKGQLFSPTHKKMYEHLKRELGNIQIETFPDCFRQWLTVYKVRTTKRGKFPTIATINRILQTVKACFNEAVNQELIEKNPITKARFPKLKEKPRDRYLNQDERTRLLNIIQKYRPYLLPIIQYMLLVPCRKMELVTARREQYNQFNQTIFIPDSKGDIPIYKPVPKEMKSYFDSIPVDCPYLFFRKDEKGYHHLGDFKRAFKYCVKKAELQNIRIHDLRHISATDLYEAGNPERMIMDIAGWKTSMLSTYRHKNGLLSAQTINFPEKVTTIQQSSAESVRFKIPENGSQSTQKDQISTAAV